LGGAGRQAVGTRQSQPARSVIERRRLIPQLWFAPVSRGIEQTISLLRQDDVLVARFPATNRTGVPVPVKQRANLSRFRG
jgi:hypothetical protein